MARERQEAQSESYRKWVVDLLAPALPARWSVAPYRRSLQDIKEPTVFVNLQRIERLQEAPLGAQSVTYLVTLVDPATDWSRADARLDDEVVDLLAALDAVAHGDGRPFLRWTGAEQNAWQGYLAFDITVTAVITLSPKE